MVSKKSEVSTKIEDEDKTSLWDAPSVASDRKKSQSQKFSFAPNDLDDNLDYLSDFDIEEAWSLLTGLQDCVKLVLTDEQQKNMGIVIGLNITSEFPWKQVKLKVLREYLPDDDETAEMFEDKFVGMRPDDLILVGYASMLSDEKDTFLLYTSHESAKRASDIIKTIEIYQRWLLNQATMKTGRRWVSKGSEKEVDLGIVAKRTHVVDVEIQSVYPIKHSEAMFRNRYSADVRDGYVELVPGDKKFENVFRRRIDASIQSAPPRVHLEQQTDPTFPSNAWSQYLYEINPDDEGLDPSEDEQDEDKKKKSKIKPTSKPGTPDQSKTPELQPPPPPPEMSNQVQSLLSTLEFNQVDMYRNDYPLIASSDIPKYSVPFLQEVLCFANISRSINRYVCGVDWYPTLSGLLATSYTFSTLGTTETGDSKVDPVRRAVLEPNPVLMWSFDDSLHHKIEFQAPREVTYLSFCPYDENILIGGTMNGQIIIWDIQNRIANGEVEEVLTAAQSRYRIVMHQYLSWTQPADHTMVVRPAAVSALATSHTGPVTNVKWLGQNHYITATGQARESENENNRFFVTCSMDGTISFWNLDAPTGQKRTQMAEARNIPQQLIQDVSEFKKFDRIFRPQFIIEHKQPLTSILFNRAKFEYFAESFAERQRTFSQRVTIKVKPIVQRNFQQFMVVSTMIGGLQQITWEGFDFVQSTEVNKEVVQNAIDFAPVHDGAVLSIRRNPFCDQVFASVGKNVLAIWKEGVFWTPIFWRKRPAAVTTLEWSLDRPSILFMCRSDGTFEAWDLLSRTDDACLVDTLGGSIITALSEHRPIMDHKVIGIGDYNSSFRILVLPAAFRSKLPKERERLIEFIDREQFRKNKIVEWENQWRERNCDILHAKKQLEEQAQLELERLLKEVKVMEDARLKKEAEEARKNELKQKKKFVYDLPERLEKKWDEMNLKRLTNVLMTRKHVDHVKLTKQTALEKDRLAFERNKKTSISKSFKTIDEDVATIRARLLPVIREDKERIDMVRESGRAIVEDADTYETVESESTSHIENFPVSGDVHYSEFLERGRQRRLILNKSLGANTERKNYYINSKRDQNLVNFKFGYDRFFINSNRVGREFSKAGDDLEIFPVRLDANFAAADEEVVLASGVLDSLGEAQKK